MNFGQTFIFGVAGFATGAAGVFPGEVALGLGAGSTLFGASGAVSDFVTDFGGITCGIGNAISGAASDVGNISGDIGNFFGSLW